MEEKNIILELRTKFGLSQDELAEKVFVSRQAVSRWENGETTPNTETLKLLSKLFDVSINTLLGDPRPTDRLSDMTPDDAYITYCKWCYSKEEVPSDFVKYYASLGEEFFDIFKQQIIDEFNGLGIEGMPTVDRLNLLPGSFINLEYNLPNGQCVRFLDDNATYLGNQLESLFGGDRCLGIAAGMDFLLVCSYEADGKNPELILYKKR